MAAIDVDELTGQMVAAGKGLVAGVWHQIESFAIPELKKIAIQVAALAEPDSPWSDAQKKILFRMQVRSAMTIIVAMTALTLQLVQDTINAVLGAVRDVINGAVGLPLIA